MGLTMKPHVNFTWFSNTENEIEVFYINSRNICTYYVYFKLKKKLVHSDLLIYRISFFLLDVTTILMHRNARLFQPKAVNQIVTSLN